MFIYLEKLGLKSRNERSLWEKIKVDSLEFWSNFVQFGSAAKHRPQKNKRDSAIAHSTLMDLASHLSVRTTRMK